MQMIRRSAAKPRVISKAVVASTSNAQAASYTPKRSASSKNRQHDVQQRIAQHAYRLFEGRGGQDGHDVEDWLQAEREVLESVTAEGSTTNQKEIHHECTRANNQMESVERV
jgi:hypothetical protein